MFKYPELLSYTEFQSFISLNDVSHLLTSIIFSGLLFKPKTERIPTMKLRNVFVFIVLFFIPVFSYGQANNNERLWFEYPALHWNSQALHIGNGHLGGSFYGGIKDERFDITEKTMWTGGPGQNPNYNYGIKPGGREHLEEIRQAIVNGNVALADSLTSRYMTGDYTFFGAFSMIGNLYFAFDDHEGTCTEYVRELDVSNSLAHVSYKMDGKGYHREYFCSYPDRVMVIRFKSDVPGKLGLTIQHELTQTASELKTEGNEMLINGTINRNKRLYCVKIKVLNDGGSVTAGNGIIKVSNANAVTVIYAAATEYLPVPPLYKGADPETLTRSRIDSAVRKGYEGLKKSHIADYCNLYDRVKLTMEGDPSLEKLPTNKRWETLKTGLVDDAGLKVLLFNLGRYLIISASRPGAPPSTLQGVWNTFPEAPWQGNYQSNINFQEMYWPCGPTNLLECQEPYIDWVSALVVPGREVAKAYYGTGYWVSHTTGNIWGYTAPGTSIKYGMYPVGAAWHCQHLWEQYAFSMDKTYLREKAYPIMKEAAQFWLVNLVGYKGKLISAPSVAAEHGPQEKDGKYIDPTIGIDMGEPKDGSVFRYNIPGAYQDIEMIYDLFTNVMQAADALGTDRDFRNKVEQTRDKLLPLKIGKYGQLQEWDLDIDSPRDHHRHISHLYAVQPGRMISPLTTPELAKAAKVSLNMRGDGLFGPKWFWAGGNWARNWRIWCWARLLDGERACKIFNEMVVEQVFENLMTFEHVRTANHMQVDASMSTPGFMAEMLLQSHLGEIHLLPALPVEWHSGSVTGLLARGAFRVSMEWKYNHLIRATIEPLHGGAIPRVRVAGEVVDIRTDRRFQ